MPVIKPTCVNDLKMRVNIVDVVSRVATLRKAGNRFKGLCPFHQEKTPSFNVNGDKGFFKCFGCGVGGDVLKAASMAATTPGPAAASATTTITCGRCAAMVVTALLRLVSEPSRPTARDTPVP